MVNLLPGKISRRFLAAKNLAPNGKKFTGMAAF